MQQKAEEEKEKDKNVHDGQAISTVGVVDGGTPNDQQQLQAGKNILGLLPLVIKWSPTHVTNYYNNTKALLKIVHTWNSYHTR